MAHLAPPLTFTLTPRQVAWLDGRRLHGCLSRSAALRLALDELIQLEGEQQESGRQWHGPQQSRQRQPTTAAAAISATTTAATTTADATAAPGEGSGHA